MTKKGKDVDTGDDIVPEDEEVSGFKGKSEKKLRVELKKVQKEKQEYLEGWQRARADLINFKREAEKAQQKLAKFATQDIVVQILPVLDSFEAAISHGADKGTQQIYKQLLGVLKTSGVEEMNPEGEKFDPTQHESVGGVSVENKKDDGTIVEVIQKGYKLHDKVVRPAKVKIGEFKE